MRLGRSPREQALLFATVGLAVLLGVTAAAVGVRRGLPMGLEGRYYGGLAASASSIGALGDPVFTTIDERPNTAALRSHAAEIPPDWFTATWEGFFLASRSGSHRFELESDDGSRLDLDGIIVVDNWGEHEARTVSRTLPLDAGAHRIRIEYQQVAGEAVLEVRWDGSREGTVRPFASEELSTRRPIPIAWQVRPFFARSGPILAAAWSGSLISLFFVPALLFLIKHLQTDTGARRLLAGVVGVALLLDVIGNWWGLPPWSWLAWAPDEVVPSDVLEIIDLRFANGWHRAYPAGHYYVLAWFFAPTLVAANLGLVEPAVPGSATFLTLFVIARMVTALMAALTVVVVHLIGQDLYGPKAGAFAAFVTACAIPFGFYSKLANLDVPYLFWFALSFWCYARIVRRGRAIEHYGYAVAATLSICTKDQAYALYLLPSLHIAFAAWRSGAGASRILAVWRRLAGPTLAAVAVFAVVHNFAFNFDGFVNHVRIRDRPAVRELSDVWLGRGGSAPTVPRHLPAVPLDVRLDRAHPHRPRHLADQHASSRAAPLVDLHAIALVLPDVHRRRRLSLRSFLVAAGGSVCALRRGCA